MKPEINSAMEPKMNTASFPPVRPPVDRAVLAAEISGLTPVTTFRGVEIYRFHGTEAPQLMQEIGRIREQEFRLVGAGRGGDVDLDERDFDPLGYHQILAWDPDNAEVIGAYRYIRGCDAIQAGRIDMIRLGTLFSFSDRFINDYLPCSIELGRSVVQREAKRAIAGLSAVWCGLGALVREDERMRYFCGNVSLYKSLSDRAVALIIGYLMSVHQSAEPLVTPRPAVALTPGDNAPWDPAVVPGAQPTASLTDLQEAMRKMGEMVPPILLSYVKACRTMAYFGAARDADFGNAVEAAIMIPVADIDPATRRRFIDTPTG